MDCKQLKKLNRALQSSNIDSKLRQEKQKQLKRVTARLKKFLDDDQIEKLKTTTCKKTYDEIKNLVTFGENGKSQVKNSPVSRSQSKFEFDSSCLNYQGSQMSPGLSPTAQDFSVSKQFPD